ncbi:MAG TPA: hypothetical protein VGP55_15105 [Chitinophagaceae bacterium]|nr:hypothetical protein [Chitinophagaceae bacterium]
MILLEDLLTLHDFSIKGFGGLSGVRDINLLESAIARILVMIALLKECNIQVNASNDNLYQFTISISNGETKFDQIVEWLRINNEGL